MSSSLEPPSTLQHLPDAELRKIGLLELIRRGNDNVVDELAKLAAGARRIARLSWDPTNGPLHRKYEDGEPAQAFVIYNDGAADCYVGETNVGLTAGGANTLITVKAGTWVALPIVTARLFVSGAAAGSVLVLAFDHAVPPGAGNLGYVSGPGQLAAGSSVGTFPTDHPYARGKLANAVAIAAAQTLNYDLVTAGYNRLRVEARMTAGVGTDLSSATRGYEDDGVTLEGGAANGVMTLTAAGGSQNLAALVQQFAAGVAVSVQSFDLTGVDKVQVRAVNNNAAGQTLTIVYTLQK